MSQQEKRFYEFGDFRIDVVKRRLMRAGEIVPLAPKVFDLLLTLAERSGKTIEKDELMQKVWPDVAVEENNLTQNIYTLRKIFGESRNDHRFIATIPGVGYRFVAEVTPVAFDDDEVYIKDTTEARISIARSDEGDQAPRPASTIEPILSEPARRRFNKRLVVELGALVALLVAATSFVVIRSRRSPDPVEPFRVLTFDQLTHTGITLRGAVSPDGKHLIYSTRESDRESLWMRQLATGSTQQIVAPQDVTYSSLIFSHDGNYIYFVRDKAGDEMNVLYKMPALGGIPVRLASGMESVVSLSPDDRRLAFIRNSEKESAIMIANADGSDIQQLAVRPITDEFKVPSWSPDGKTIACSTGSGEPYDTRNSVVLVTVENGTEKPLTAEKWSWTRWVEWLSDGSGLLLTARDLPAKPIQIWHVSYPGGAVRRITNDSRDYHTLSLTADSKTLVATQTELLSDIWLTSIDERGPATKITFGSGQYGDASFTPDGRIIYSSLESGNMDLWRISDDGTDKRQLTTDTSVDMHQAASPDGRYIVFASDRAGKFNIWRIDSNGGNPLRLTSGAGEKFPNCSPDGKWVLYNTVAEDDQLYALWRVPIDGGDPVRIAQQTYAASFSPDGKHIAYFLRQPRSALIPRLVVIPFEGGQPEHVYDLPLDEIPVPVVRWTQDSRALLYATTSRGICNVWMKMLDASPPKKVADLKLEGKVIIDVSPDGKRIVVTRRFWTFDLVLLTRPS